MKRYSFIRYIALISFCISLFAWSGCTNEAWSDADEPALKADGILQISTRATEEGTSDEQAIRTLRLLVFKQSDGSLLFNKKYLTKDAVTTIPEGTYSYFAYVNGSYLMSDMIPKVPVRIVVIANELESVDGTGYTYDHIRESEIRYSSYYINTGKFNIDLTDKVEGTNKGYLPMYGESAPLSVYDWNASGGKVVTMSLKRTVAKITLNIKRKKDTPIAGIDVGTLTVNSASVIRIPESGWWGKLFPYEDTQISTVTKDFPNPITITAANNVDQETGKIVFYIPENTLSDRYFADSKYTCVQVNANLNVNGTSANSSYKIPLGDGTAKWPKTPAEQLTRADLTISRNTHYNIEATITSTGKLEVLKIETKVNDWAGTEEVGGDVDVPLLNISSQLIQFGKATQKTVKIHFWTNQKDVTLDENYTKLAGGVATTGKIGDVFKDLKVVMHVTGTNPDYFPYNGVVDVTLNNDNLYIEDAEYTLTLKAGKLKRTITVKTNQ